MNYEQETQVAMTAVTLAAQLCEQVRSQQVANAIAKSDHSPVTIADFGSQALICRLIAEAFPQDAIVAEEDAAVLRQPGQQPWLDAVTAQVQPLMPEATAATVTDWIDRGNGSVADRYWTLDPIDGTKGFLRGGQYAIALALIEAGEVQLGVMACPALATKRDPAEPQGALFVAVRGEGTQLLSLDRRQSYPVRVTQHQPADGWRLAESIEARHGNPALQRSVAAAIGLTAPPLQMDSQAKYGAVATGAAALYLRLPWTEQPDYQENGWDHAAGAIVVQEAGGRVTDMQGKPLDFSVGPKLIHNRGIVASNGALHEPALAALKQLSYL